jgi:hypothetical protein
MTSSPNDLSEAPPTGCTIQTDDASDDRNFEWQPASHHPVQWFAIIGGSMCTVMAASFMVGALVYEPPKPDDLRNIHVHPFADLNPLFMLPHLLMGLYFVWAGWRKGHPERVSLGKNTFGYDTGSPMLPTLIGWMFWRMAIQGGAWFGLSGSNAPFRHIRKRVEIPVDELAELKLERVGERQRLTIDHGADRIEIGAGLREPEWEWLAARLEAWLKDEVAVG